MQVGYGPPEVTEDQAAFYNTHARPPIWEVICIIKTISRSYADLAALLNSALEDDPLHLLPTPCGFRIPMHEPEFSFALCELGAVSYTCERATSLHPLFLHGACK